MDKFFDAYSVKVRLSSLLILLGPAIIWTLLFVEEIRNLSSLVFVSAVIYAVSMLLAVPLRKRANAVMKVTFDELPTITFLSEKNSKIDEKTRIRYCKKLQCLLGNSLIDSSKKEDYASALEWLKSNYHKSERAHLVEEENMIFGLICNLKGVKCLGIALNVVLLIITVLYYFLSGRQDLTTHVIAGDISIAFLCLWIFVVTEENLKYAANKYATALLSCIDSIDIAK